MAIETLGDRGTTGLGRELDKLLRKSGTSSRTVRHAAFLARARELEGAGEDEALRSLVAKGASRAWAL